MSRVELQVRAFRKLDELYGLRSAWEDLLSAYPLSTTFSTFEWLSCWWRNFSRSQDLLVLAFFEKNALIALAPLSIKHERIVGGLTLKLLRLMGDGSKDSDNLDIPVRPGYEARLVGALLTYLDQNKALWDCCELNTLPASSSTLAGLREALQERGWPLYSSQRVASAIPLPDTWEAYLQLLSSEDQKNLTRYSRRLEKRYQTRLYRCTQAEELPRILEALFQLHQARWQAEGETGSFASPERRAFYYDLSRSLLSRGWLELWVLEANGEIASVQYAFRCRDAVYQLQEGNNPEKSSDRVGFILRGAVLKQLIAEGVRLYDFLGGEPGYKARWGAKPGHYVDLDFAARFSLGAAYLRTRHKAMHTKEWLRRSLPKSAWDVLHRANQRVRPGKVPAPNGALPISDPNTEASMHTHMRKAQENQPVLATQSKLDKKE
jgi:CelD/BcsL family acetyltransferase involved in cellulose biosynthesis